MNWEEEIKNIIPKKDNRLMHIEEIGNKIIEELKKYEISIFFNVYYPEREVTLRIDYYHYKFSLDDVLRLELNKKMNTEEAVRYIIKDKLKKRFELKNELFEHVEYK